jgi:hypothetical protein
MKLTSLAVLLAAALSCTAAEFKSRPWTIIKAAGPKLQQLGWVVPRSSAEIASSPWSVGCETLDRDYTIFKNYRPYVGELGAKSARLQSGWARCEKAPGVYTFEWLDEVVNGLKEQGVKPWICLCYGNPIYGSDRNLGARVLTTEPELVAWCRYVEAIVNRYKEVVTEWEVWNEPKRDEGRAYANLFLRTAEVIKRVQPNATLIGLTVHGFAPVVQHFSYARDVLEVLREKGKLELLDYVSYHPYTYNPDDGNASADELAQLVHSFRREIKMFQAESGAPSEYHVHHALANHPWTEFSQPKWLLRRMAGDRMRDIRTSVFAMIDMRYPQVLLSKGLLRSDLQNTVIYRKPSFYAVQHMMSLFDETVSPIGVMKHESDQSRPLTVAGFRQHGLTRLLVWQHDRTPTDDLKWEITRLKVEGVAFKDPVYVELISGKVYALPPDSRQSTDNSVTFHGLPLWDSVIMIAERSQVPIGPARN